MGTKEIVKGLRARAKEIKEELKYIQGLLEMYGDVEGEKLQQSFESEFYPELKPEDKKPESLTSKAKRGIQELMNYPLSYQKEDIKYNLEKMGISEITKSTLHAALTDLRNEGKVLGYRLNRSNQLVFYMSSKGKNNDNERYPVKENYRPKNYSTNEINDFEFLD